MTGTPRGDCPLCPDAPLAEDDEEGVVTAFLCLELVDGDEGGMVAAVHVSVTGHSSDLTFLTTLFGTMTGG